MKYLDKVLAIFMFTNLLLYPSPEEAYIEIEMKGEKNEFYRVLIDYETDDIYLGVGDFIDFSKIENLKFDKKKLRIKGNLDEENKIDIKLSKEEVIELEDDIFLKIEEFKKLFKISNYNWDDERYILNLYPSFKTPKEYSAILNNRRSIIAMNKKNEEMEAQGNYLKAQKKLLSPGILKLSYSNTDFEENDYNFGIDYGTELFYGEFQLSQEIYPENKLDYIRLQYDKIFGSYFLTFGDFSLESDSIFNVERNLRGISFSKNEYYGIRVDNRTIIEGEIFNARFVELYRNGILDDFEIINGNNFRFEPLTLSSSDKYTVKIYYRDGREETKDIYILGNQTILNKGETDFLIQSGQGVDDKKNQYLAKFKYGLTKDMTVSLGTSILENRESQKYNVLESGISYRFGLDEYPTLISATILNELESKDFSYKSLLEQKLLYNMNLVFRYENYEGETAKRLRQDFSYNIDLSKGFRRLTTSVGYFQNSYDMENLYQIYLNLDYTLSSSIRVSLSNEYYKFSSSENKSLNSNGYGSQIKINYSGANGIGAILEGRLNYEENKLVDDEIRLGLIKTPTENGFFRNIDTAFDIGYSNEKGTFFEIRFTYIFDDNIYIEFPDIRTENKKTRVGGRVEKAFYLGDPFLPINNNSVTDGWVEGKVFVDENGNGTMDEKESIYEGAEIITGGGASTANSKGEYTIGNIRNRDIHTVEVNRETIDPMLVQGSEIIKFEGATSSRTKLDIPLVPVSMITGIIENNEVSSEREYNGVLAGVDVILKKDNEEIKRTQPEIDGYYFFEDILPGDYVVELVSSSKRYKGDFDKQKIEIKIKTGREGDYYEDNNFLVKNIEIVEDEILDEEEKPEELAQENTQEGENEKNS